ncbi:MAG TPA: hypothetical protein VMT61_11925 [Candidatus Binataceae bacterium]|nr:hypothetical protein [Candidatus Binataceae bacterium]
MNGYQYLVQRNRLMCELEDEIRKLGDMPDPDRAAAVKQVEARFDIRLRQLYAQVASEYPGERKIKARPITDPR